MSDLKSNGRPAALFIAPIMPNDLGNGLAMRTGFLLDTYAKRFAIDLAVIPIAGGTTEITPFVEARVRHAIVLLPTGFDTHFTLIRKVADPDARLSAFRHYGRPSITARLSSDIERALLSFAGNRAYELIHVSRLYLASLAPAWIHAKDRPCLVLDCDEDDASTFQRFARLHRMWGRGLQADWAEAEADGFKVLARQFLPRFDLLLAASPGEARRVARYAVEATVVPNVAPECNKRRTSLHPKGLRRDILFVGNMGYLPNIDAVMWFATRIWPRLRSAVPFPLRFVIAGHGAPREVIELTKDPGITLAGGFIDPAPLYRRAALTVVPIRAGGGTRIKLLESAKYGVPIVATRLGAEGSSFRSGQELLLADSAQGFAACCARLLTNFRLASFLAAKAQRTLRRDYDARRCARRLLDTIETRRRGTGMS